MTTGGYVASLFPFFHVISLIMAFIMFCKHPTLETLAITLFVIYLFPLIVFRVHQLFFPLSEGKSRLDVPIYSSWWASHQFQALFNAIPALEALLRLMPGLYSQWLRLWGSTIGRQVHWTPQIEITDRSLVIVGDHVIFGHKVMIFSHVVVRHPKGETYLYVRKVRIGSRAFLGAGSKLGPGSLIKPDTIVPLQTELKVNQRL